MSLELVLGVHILLNAASEGIVDGVPLVHHRRGALVQELLDPVPHISGSSSLALRSLDVVVAELGPRFRHRGAVSVGRCTG